MAFMLFYVMIKMTIVNFYENGKMIENNENHDEEYEKVCKGVVGLRSF